MVESFPVIALVFFLTLHRDWSRRIAPPFNQSDEKPNLIAALSRTFSRNVGSYFGFVLSCPWAFIKFSCDTLVLSSITCRP